MSKELRIGVIGAGGRGWLTSYAHRPEEGVRIVAAADIDPKPLEAYRQKYGKDTFVTDDYRQLLARADVDVIFVTTPDFWHEEHAVAALTAGKAVYLEKPMAITIQGCDRILQTAYKNKAKLFLGHNMRHFGIIRKMRELIKSGAIGEVKAGWCRHFISYGGDAYFKDWHSERKNTTGLLLQKGAHDIDVLHWLCGGYSRVVTALGGLTVYDRVQDRRKPYEQGITSWSEANWPPLSQKKLSPIIDVEDISMMMMRLDNGVFCSYQQCHYAPDAWRNYTVIGAEGRIENYGDGPGDKIVLWNKRATCYKPEGDHQFAAPPAEGSHGGGDPSIVAEFIRYVREGGKIATSPIAARFSVAAGCQATESLRNGGVPLEVPPLPANIVSYFSADVEA